MAPTVRHPVFDLDSVDDPLFTPASPAFALAANAVSLMMPYVEPLFARSAREALPTLDEPLRTEAARYAAQERAHFAVHARYNAIIRRHHPAVAPLEVTMRRTYGAIERRTSLPFRLAFASASETMAFVVARWTEHRAHRLFRGAQAEVVRLFVWHLAEEVEHKSVAFDVHRRVGAGRLRSASAALLSLALLAVFVLWGVIVMAVTDRLWWRPTVWGALVHHAVTFAFDLLPALAISLFADHHPRRLRSPTTYERWLTAFDNDER